MLLDRPLVLLLAAPLLLALTACSTALGPDTAAREAGVDAALEREDAETLTLIVSALRVHLREDTYRFPHARTRDGRDIFGVSLWKLDRLARLRASETPNDSGVRNVDLVIDFGRARALERLRRYAEASAAYDRVARVGSLLADEAVEASRVMVEFAEVSVPVPALADGSDAALERIEARIARWQDLAREHRGTTHESLAREEAESWEVQRVDWLERHASLERALAASRRLIERNHASKHYASHLLRLGDLYADAARREQPAAGRRDPKAEVYERLLDRAFSAYELASEDRAAGLRREADTRIEALLAQHRGVVERAR